MTHTSAKKLAVDSHLIFWSAPGIDFNVFEDAQEAFQAKAAASNDPPGLLFSLVFARNVATSGACPE